MGFASVAAGGQRSVLLSVLLSMCSLSLVVGSGAASASVTGAQGADQRSVVTVRSVPGVVTAGSALVVSGVVSPARSGVRLVLQRRVASGWVPVSAGASGAGGRFGLRLRVPHGPSAQAGWSLRVLRPAMAGAVGAAGGAAVSRVFRVRGVYHLTLVGPGSVLATSPLVLAGTLRPALTAAELAAGAVELQQQVGARWVSATRVRVTGHGARFQGAVTRPVGSYRWRAVLVFRGGAAAGVSPLLAVTVTTLPPVQPIAPVGPPAAPIPPTPVIGPAVTTTVLPAAARWQPYTSVLAGQVGSAGGPLGWVGTGLPDGLSLDPGSGAVTGTPTTVGVFTLMVTVTDPAGLTGQATLTLAITAGPTQGQLQAWGSNTKGQLGGGGTTGSAVPVPVPGLDDVTATTGGAFGGYALSAGSLWGWGLNDSGQLGNNTTKNSAVPVKVLLAGAAPVTEVAAGENGGYGLLANGTLWAWGDNTYGQVGIGQPGPPILTPVRVAMPGPAPVDAVASGGYDGYALRSGGTVWAWGGITASVTPTQVTGLSGIIAIAAGGAAGYALDSHGVVWAWGQDNYGQLGDGTTKFTDVPVPVSGLSGIVAIAGGLSDGYALDSAGVVWAWGANQDGELGNGSTTTSKVPVKVTGLSGITAIAGGAHDGYALDPRGGVSAWGDNTVGQLGSGSGATALTPVPVSGLHQVIGLGTGASRDSGYAIEAD